MEAPHFILLANLVKQDRPSFYWCTEVILERLTIMDEHLQIMQSMFEYSDLFEVLKYLIFGFRTAGFHAIAQRVSHSLYEVSDRLSFFLCQRRPDHNSGQHFLVPDLNKPRYAPHI